MNKNLDELKALYNSLNGDVQSLQCPVPQEQVDLVQLQSQGLTDEWPTMICPPVAEIRLEEDFDRGNMNLATSSADQNLVTLYPRLHEMENGNTPQWQFFMCKVVGMDGHTPLFKLHLQSHTSGTNLKGAWKPVYSYDLVTWFNFSTDQRVGDFSEFSNNSPFTGDVYVAYQQPYQVATAEKLLNDSLADNRVTPLGTDGLVGIVPSQSDENGRVIVSQPIFAFKLGTGALNAVIISGQHAGEDIGNWPINGVVEFLLSGDAVAESLLSKYTYFIYPLVNPMGRFGGHRRGQWQPGYLDKDPNRQWNNSNIDNVALTRASIEFETGSQIDFFMDFHAQKFVWGRSEFFMYGSDTDEYTAFHAAIPQTVEKKIGSGTLWTADRYFRQYTNHSYAPEITNCFGTTMAEQLLYGENMMRAMDSI